MARIIPASSAGGTSRIKVEIPPRVIDHHDMVTTPLLLLITGWPATGKTTLAKQLAAELKWPLIAKDGIKECLFDSLGAGDRAWSSKLSIASYALCLDLAERTLAANVSCVLEANFKSEPWAARIESMVRRTECLAHQIHCRAERQVIKSRFDARIRHPGHLDDQLRAEVEQQFVTQEQRPLGLSAKLTEIDTSAIDEPTAVRFVLDRILGAPGRGHD